MKEKVVLAYSGGLDTSITIPWLKENYDIDVIAVCANVGQDDDMDKVHDKAIKSGAIKAYCEDLREEFITTTIYAAIKSEVKYEGRYLLGTALARPIIAKKLVEIAHKEGAKYICHGCTGKGNDQVRFEGTIAALDPTIKVIAPWRIWDIKSREDAIDYANEHNIEVVATKKKIYSVDDNLFHVSTEGGDIECLQNEHSKDIYKKTQDPEDACDTPEYVEIYFKQGVPKKVNNEELSPIELLETLDKLGCKHGIGIVEILENRLVGMKSRGIYETPGGEILYTAHNYLESATLDKDSLHLKQRLSLEYADLIYNGKWYSKACSAITAFMNETQENVTGSVKLKLYKGNIKPAGIFTENALYDESISSFGNSELYDHKDAEGFINLFTLPLKINAMKDMKSNK
ncbi:MAG: argininosuccinate synthase [Clostridiales bacterium]|uniref:argininosuccinate synthase n=1 Tax=Terrisporobacter sp. TaxID=1965305 RepID=UPI002A582098|nr:argininosuccinate synthase [Terrisporobacter sp.]MDD7753129.1 argininosuccinate synthase [Clostridiales bacterium]MDY4134340.1 argininosuccinate synthase [Terrisporobacter sp.]